MSDQRSRKEPPRSIMDIVTELKRFYGISPDVPMEEVPGRWGIEIIESTLPTPDGFLDCINRKWFLGLHPDLAPPDREITIAHELAHTHPDVGDDDDAAESCAAELVFERRWAQFNEPGEDLDKLDPYDLLARFYDSIHELVQLRPHLADREKIMNVFCAGLMFIIVLVLGAIFSGDDKFADHLAMRIQEQ